MRENSILASLSDAELAILQATKYSEHAQSAQELAQHAETTTATAKQAITSLVQKHILMPYEDKRGDIFYMYDGGDYAQAVYDALYGPLKEGESYA